VDVTKKIQEMSGIQPMNRASQKLMKMAYSGHGESNKGQNLA
jgi:hypothetical protein